MLAVEGLEAQYGRARILDGVSFRAASGEVVVLLGRNGAGKSTTLKAIMGLVRPSAGRVVFEGRDIAGLEPFRIARAGLGYVPEERRVFAGLTVRENLEVAARPGRWTIAEVFRMFPKLAARERNRGNQLSGGEQQMLAIGRALIGNPSVLLMDEPSEGLAPVIVEELVRAVKQLAQAEGLTLVLVEQNTRIALDVSPRTVVMDRGRIVYDGPSDTLKQDAAKLDQLIGLAKL